MTVPEPRSTVRAIGGGVDVVIPARTSWVTVIFISFWLCGWAWGVANRLLSPSPHPQMITQGRWFSLIWITLWTIGGLFALLTVLWNLAGRERLRFSRSEVVLRREVLGSGLGQTFDPRRVTNLRAIEIPTGPFGQPANRGRMPWSGGPLAFDYGATTIRFGAGIDFAEASHLVEKITSTATWLNSKSS
jgi:hypothetical protein